MSIVCIDNDSNEGKNPKLEFSAYSSVKQITGRNKAYYYEEVDTDSHLSRSHTNQGKDESIEMTTNIVYAVTRNIETKTNVAYSTIGQLRQT